MAVRKSKRIGTEVNGYLILDSRHYANDTQYLVKCLKCGAKMWKSRGFAKAKGACPNCEGGRSYHNAKGYYHERLYERYHTIINRIKTHEEYKNIEMCEVWLNDYLKFREWSLANGYSDDLQIDRIDNTKGYSPDNCRWVTAKDNMNNRCSNKIVEYKGEVDTVSRLADKYNKNKMLIYGRLRAGWSVEEAFEKEVDRSKWSNARKSKYQN